MTDLVSINIEFVNIVSYLALHDLLITFETKLWFSAGSLLMEQALTLRDVSCLFCLRDFIDNSGKLDTSQIGDVLCVNVLASLQNFTPNRIEVFFDELKGGETIQGYNLWVGDDANRRLDQLF